MIRMLLLVIGVFILCWSPYFIWTLLLHYYSNSFGNQKDSSSYSNMKFAVSFVTNILPMFNSLCNPMIYAGLDQTYREAFKRLFQRVVRQNARIRNKKIAAT